MTSDRVPQLGERWQFAAAARWPCRGLVEVDAVSIEDDLIWYSFVREGVPVPGRPGGDAGKSLTQFLRDYRFATAPEPSPVEAVAS